MIRPQPIGGDEGALRDIREKWFKLIHSAAPDVDWQQIEWQNTQHNIARKSGFKWQKNQTLSESFANGSISGVWEEKGSYNQAGSIVAADYDIPTNNLYVISDGGSLWRNNGLAINNWSLLNDDYRFSNRILQIINKSAGGRRILVSANQQIFYSDNEGTTLSQVTIAYPVSWGGNNVVQMVKPNGSNNIYALVYFWDNVTWQPKMALYRSTTEGASFAKIHTFQVDSERLIEMVNPHNSTELFLMETNATAGKWNVYNVSGSSVINLNSVNAPESNTTIATTATFLGGVTTYYLLCNNNRLFKSTNKGVSWIFVNELPDDSWDRLCVAMDNANNLMYGGVEAFRSNDGGMSWNRVNYWYDYYNNISGKLHADIMELKQFKKQDGTIFTIIDNHGGVAISYDNMLTTSNLSEEGLSSAQYYDILTPPDSDSYHTIYSGSQDQGLQKTVTANVAGARNFTQMISGDYGYLTLAANNKIIHAEYPGGEVYSFSHPGSSYLGKWNMPGTFKPNYGWMIPMEPYYSHKWDTVLMAGGNLNGGSGSYLVKFAKQPNSPYTVHASQFNFDFRANSTNGMAGITAIEAPVLHRNRLYVGLENGNFFYSNDFGQTWTRTTNFNGPTPWYLYGSTIVASKLKPNLLWYGGSGYSNPCVYKSENGGQSFTPMNSGLPATLVHEIVANVSETHLFAATDAGPYVFVVAQNQWFPMIGANTPIQRYTSVEYVPNTNIVRFGTYGRGIWDFKLISPAIYVFTGNGNWDVPANWSRNEAPPANLSSINSIYINPMGNGICNLNVLQNIISGANLIIAPDKHILINNNLIIQ